MRRDKKAPQSHREHRENNLGEKKSNNTDGQDQALVAYAAVHWLPYLILRGPEGFVSELFVDQAARGQGVGVFSVTLGCFLNLSP